MSWLGDFDFGSTVFTRFTTVNSTGAPTALSSGGVTVYRNASTVQDATGITLTSSFDTITGLNLLQVDMSTAGFYSSAGNFTAIISSGAASEDLSGYVIAEWSILSRSPLTSTAGLETATGFSTHSTAGLETAAGFSTHSTAGLETVSTAGLETATGFSTHSTAGLETLSTAGIETASSIADVSTGSEASVAFATWDEILTGATHNVPTSAGRRLRTLQDFGLYEGGAVWVDTVNGSTTTTDFEDGTVTNPVNDMVLARTIADSIGLKIIHILPGSSDSLTQAWDDFEIIGHDYILGLGGQSVNNTLIAHGTISGTFSGKPRVMSCEIGAITGPSIDAHDCGITSTAITANAAGDWFFHHCFSTIAGTATPSFDFGVGASNTNLSMRSWSGGIEIQNMGSTGADAASIEGFGQVVLNANCSSGTIAIRGSFTVTDNAGGAVTLSDDARIDMSQINAEMVDVIATDEYEEPAFGVPSTAQSLIGMNRYMFSGLRNQITVSSSAKTFYGDANAVLWSKVLSQDSTGSTGVYTEAGASTST